MNNTEFKVIRKQEDFKDLSRKEFVDFLFTHLGDFGDPKDEIEACIDYAFSNDKYAGGFVSELFYEGKLVGGLVMNTTGMKKYIPENILVYVAVDSSYRGKGFGKKIIEESIKLVDGDVKLHVDFENKAKNLYERIGFEAKYYDMRLKK